MSHCNPSVRDQISSLILLLPVSHPLRLFPSADVCVCGCVCERERGEIEIENGHFWCKMDCDQSQSVLAAVVVFSAPYILC